MSPVSLILSLSLFHSLSRFICLLLSCTIFLFSHSVCVCISLVNAMDMKIRLRKYMIMYIRKFTRTYVYMLIYIHICTYSYIYTCIQIRVCLYVRTCESVIWHIWISRVTHMNDTCDAYEWVMSHIWIMWHMNEACDTITLQPYATTPTLPYKCYPTLHLQTYHPYILPTHVQWNLKINCDCV